MPPTSTTGGGRKGGGGKGGACGKGGQVKGAATEPQQRQDPDDETNAGFGKYLRSQEGIEMMKLFVIANTIVVFMTMAWPQMQQSYQILRSLIFSDDGSDNDDDL